MTPRVESRIDIVRSLKTDVVRFRPNPRAFIVIRALSGRNRWREYDAPSLTKHPNEKQPTHGSAFRLRCIGCDGARARRIATTPSVVSRVLQSSDRLSHWVSARKRSRRCPGSPGSDSGSSLSSARNRWKAWRSDEVPAGESVIVTVSRFSVIVPGAQNRFDNVRLASAGRRSTLELTVLLGLPGLRARQLAGSCQA